MGRALRERDRADQPTVGPSERENEQVYGSDWNYEDAVRARIRVCHYPGISKCTERVDEILRERDLYTVGCIYGVFVIVMILSIRKENRFLGPWDTTPLLNRLFLKRL